MTRLSRLHTLSLHDNPRLPRAISESVVAEQTLQLIGSHFARDDRAEAAVIALLGVWKSRQCAMMWHVPRALVVQMAHELWCMRAVSRIVH